MRGEVCLNWILFLEERNSSLVFLGLDVVSLVADVGWKEILALDDGVDVGLVCLSKCIVKRAS